MKKTLLTSVVLAITVLGFIGCSTTQSPNTTALEQFAITSAASIGTAEVVQQNPQYRPDFVIAEAVLVGISTGTNTLTAAQVNTLLQSSGVTNSFIAPVIINGFTLADQYTSTGTNATVQQVAGWVNLGIAQGLGSTFKLKK